MKTIDAECHSLRILMSKTMLQIYFSVMEDEDILGWFTENPDTLGGYDC